MVLSDNHPFGQSQSSGFVEGLNNKIKVIKRRCYGTPTWVAYSNT